MDQFWASLLGAALAFSFFLLGQAVLKAYDRAKDHHDTLVRLERMLNEHLDSVTMFRSQITLFKNEIEAGRVVFPPGTISPDDSLDAKLLDIDLVNRVFSLRLLQRRANNDMQNLRAVYTIVGEQFIREAITKDSYVQRGASVVRLFEKIIQPGLDRYTNEAEDLLARVRLHLRKTSRPAMHAVSSLMRMLMLEPVQLTEAELAAEKSALQNEITQIRSKGIGAALVERE